MGGIYVKDPAPDNQALDITGMPSLTSGYGLGAVAEESYLRSPFDPLREQQQMQARAGSQMPETGPVINMDDPFAPGTPKSSPLIPAEEANNLYGIPGELSWDKPVRTGEAQLLNKWKRDELKRQNIMARATPGVLPGAARLGVGFLVSAVDPLNVASAFIPVVGEARYAYLAERLGVTGARVARGAAEGFVGAAVVEPLVYLQAQSEQADYTANDSLLNLAFGTVLGGGLHAGFGALSDMISRQPIETREAALRGAVAAVAEDRPVRVAEAFGPTADQRFRQSMAAAPTPEGVLPAHLDRILTKAEPDQKVKSVAAYIRELGGVKDDGGDLAAMGAGAKVGLLNKRGKSIDELGEAMLQDGFDVRSDLNPDTWDVNKVKELIRRDLAGEKVLALGEEAHGARASDQSSQERSLATEANERAKELLGRNLSADELRGVMDRYHRDKYDNMADAFDDEMERALTSEPFNLRASRAGDIPFDVMDAQRSTYQPTPDEAAQAKNTEALAEGWDQPITPETGADEAAELIDATNEQVQAAKKSGDLTDQDMQTIKGDPETEKLTKGRAAGYEAAAACLSRVA